MVRDSTGYGLIGSASQTGLVPRIFKLKYIVAHQNYNGYGSDFPYHSYKLYPIFLPKFATFVFLFMALIQVSV